MPKMTPEQEAAYALDFGVARGDLSEQAQLAYDRLVEQRAHQIAQAPLAQGAAPAASAGPLAGMPGAIYPQVPPPYVVGPGTQPVLPVSMRRAVGLMWAGAGVSVVYSVVTGVVTRDLLTVQRTNTPTYHGAFVSGEVIEAFVQVALWLWMLWKVRSGRSWARVLSTVFFGFACLQTLLVLAYGPVISKALITAYFIVALSALIMLYQRESSGFFSAAALARNSFGAGYGPPGYGPPGYGPPGYGPPGYGPPGYGPPAQQPGEPPQSGGQLPPQ
jgi:hypothetical protein